MTAYFSTALYWIVQALAVALFWIGGAALARLVRGGRELRRRTEAGGEDYLALLLKSRLVPAVSTIAAPPDASAESQQFVRRLLDLHFGRNEVVIVLDGPSPADMETWIRDFRLAASARTVEQKLATARVRGVYESRDPVRIVVLDKEPGGAADAWNAGVNAAVSPIVGLLEMDSDFEPTVLLRLIQPMLEAPEEILAVCGGDAAPPSAGLPGRWAALESLRAWLAWGAARAAGNQVLPIPGSAVLASRRVVLDSGGGTANGLELILKVHAFGLASGKKYGVAFLPEPVSHARPVPAGKGAMADLRRRTLRQRSRIVRAWRRRRELGGPSGGQLLRDVHVEWSIRPRLEAAAYTLTIGGLALRWVDAPLAGVVLLATAGMGILNSMAAVVLRDLAQPARTDPDRLRAMFLAAIPENLGYRQLRTWWLTRGGQ